MNPRIVEPSWNLISTCFESGLVSIPVSSVSGCLMIEVFPTSSGSSVYGWYFAYMFLANTGNVKGISSLLETNCSWRGLLKTHFHRSSIWRVCLHLIPLFHVLRRLNDGWTGESCSLNAQVPVPVDHSYVIEPCNTYTSVGTKRTVSSSIDLFNVGFLLFPFLYLQNNPKRTRLACMVMSVFTSTPQQDPWETTKFQGSNPWLQVI